MATDALKTSPKRKKPLCDTIHNRLVKTAVPPKPSFLPSGIIDKLITSDSVVEALSTNCDPVATEIAAWVCNSEAKKLFAIAVRIRLSGNDLLDGMRQLREKGIADNDLPVTEAFWREKGLWLDDDDNESTTSIDDSDEKLIWTHSALSEFCNKQWEFMCPVFSNAVLNHDLIVGCVLPFMQKLSLECSIGGFGRVAGYEIHPDHLISPTDENFQCPKYVAVKQMYDREKNHQRQAKNWEKEAGILQKMNLLNHPHIVLFHTAFRLVDPVDPEEQSHFLMLEWANGGNLKNLWETFERPLLTAELVKAALRQILGLADAISTAHDPRSRSYLNPRDGDLNPALSHLNFRHGDLKPENILWFKDGDNSEAIGSLKIGDWGLAKQHDTFTILRSKPTTTGGGTRAYEPPEAEIFAEASLDVPENLKKKKSRLYDIWSMGCITLEFLIWLVYGKDQWRQFRTRLSRGNEENTRFYKMTLNSGRYEATVHRVARLWMDHMAQDPIFAPGTTALGNLLEAVRDMLLVVKLPQNLGSSANMSQNIHIPQQSVSNGNAKYRGTGDERINDGSRLSSMPGSTSETRAASPAIGPNIVIEETPDLVEHSEPVVPEQRKSKGRARADQFRDRMVLISGEDEEERYFYIGQPDPPRGPDPDDDEPIKQQDNEYQTEDAVEIEASPDNQVVPTTRTEMVVR